MKKTSAAIALLLLVSGAAIAQEPVAGPPAAAEQAPAPATAAPAANAGDWMQYKNPYAGEENNIVNPHRTNDEISAWASKAVADTLSFKTGEFNDGIRGAKTYFVEQGWRDYVAYLQDTKLLDIARSGKYSVSTASDGEPMILNSGSAGGAWRWQVSTPVITSVTRPDQKGNEQTVSSRRAKIQITLARVAEGGGADGIVIESWKVTEGGEDGAENAEEK